MSGFVLPLLATILASKQRGISDLVSGCGHGRTAPLVLFRMVEQLNNKHEGEADNPQHELNRPPPPANEYPPQKTVMLLTGFEMELGLGFAALLFLEGL